MRKFVWIVAAVAVLIIALLIYRRNTSNLNVDPHAREEIDKARQR